MTPRVCWAHWVPLWLSCVGGSWEPAAVLSCLGRGLSATGCAGWGLCKARQGLSLTGRPGAPAGGPPSCARGLPSVHLGFLICERGDGLQTEDAHLAPPGSLHHPGGRQSSDTALQPWLVVQRSERWPCPPAAALTRPSRPSQHPNQDFTTPGSGPRLQHPGEKERRAWGASGKQGRPSRKTDGLAGRAREAPGDL